ncbi:G3E family GTPase [Novosphingobium sp. 1529]|uniref:CobW family GTP-binding protein n=1 Tax=Novosphingobium sp. 1529 TaxID=3156424 RepID=UPI003399CF43
MAIPILLLTGYLGSGKTTLLSQLLRDPAFARTALLVNEVGEIGIDQLVLAESEGTEPVVLLDGGCVCCSIRGDLGMALRNLSLRAERGDIPQFERVVIETTGIARPVSIIRLLSCDAWIRQTFFLHSVISCVDGVFGPLTLQSSLEAREQAIAADRIVVTKSDIADEGSWSCTLDSISQLNPLAELLFVTQGACEAAVFLAPAPIPFQPVLERLGRKGDTQDGHALPVSTASITIQETRSWGEIAMALDRVAKQYSGALLRTKGVCRIAEIDRPILVQGVRDVFSPPLAMRNWAAGERCTTIVFIAENDAASAIRADFLAALT